MSATLRTLPLAVSGLFFRGEVLFATTSLGKERGGSIVGYSGALLRVDGERPHPLFESKKLGLLAGAALASGDIAVSTTESEIVVLAPDGKVRRQFASGLVPYHSPDYLVVGGAPERLFVASRAYSNAKSGRAEEWDTSAWTKGKTIAFTSTHPLSVSARGVARTTSKGYANADSWGVLEYAWKGAPKAIKTPTQRSSWCVSMASGFLVSDSQTAAFVEPSGAVRWTIAERVIAACALGDTLIAVLTWKGLVVADVASGAIVESHPLEFGDDESWATPCPIAASAGGSVAFASESRLVLVERSNSAQLAAPSATPEVARMAAPPTPEEIAKAATTAKAKAKREADEADRVVSAVREITEQITASDDVKLFKKLHAKLRKLDILESSDEPKNAKQIAKCVTSLRARLKALSGSPAASELEGILDTLTSS
ncbi:MAG: hypothetical protein U0271_08525 [Polyangiaceae bacterium]